MEMQQTECRANKKGLARKAVPVTNGPNKKETDPVQVAMGFGIKRKKENDPFLYALHASVVKKFTIEAQREKKKLFFRILRTKNDGQRKVD